MEWRVLCPSYRRAGKVRSFDLFGDSLVFCVHEFEADEYRDAYPGSEILVLPDETRRNMGKVRNYIRDNSGADRYLMVDDDMEWFGYHEQCKRRSMDRESIEAFIENGFEMAEELGTILWGVNLVDVPRTYRQYSPISLLSPVLGPFCGHIGHDRNIRYDERLGLNEDYDFFLQVMQRYHKVLRLNKYFYKVGHLAQAGGCGEYRMMEEEKRQAAIMVRKWGGDVVKYNFEKSTNPRIHLPFRGI